MIDPLAPTRVVPEHRHANGQYASASWQKKQAEKHGHTDHEVVALADGHGLVIEGDDVRVV